MPGRFSHLRAAVVSAILLLPASGAAAGTVLRTFTFSPADVVAAADEQGYTRYTLSGGVPWGEPGGPELPALSVLVDLPEGTRALSVRAVPGGFVTVGA